MAQYAFSIAVNNLKKKYGMSDPAYLIYADLRAAGWSQTDAWNVAFQGKGLNWSKAELLKEMNKLETLNSVQSRIADLRHIRYACGHRDAVHRTAPIKSHTTYFGKPFG